VRSQETVDEGVVEGNDAVLEEVDGTKVIKRSPKDPYCKKRIAFEEHTAELDSENPTRTLQNLPVKVQRPSTSGDPHVTASRSPVNRNIDEEKPTTSKTMERKEVESDSADDVVVLGPQPSPEERTEDPSAASRSDETQRDGPVRQEEMEKDVGGNVVVV